MKEGYLWEFGCTKILQNENPIVRNVHILMHHIIKKNILGLKEICEKFELLAFNFLLQPMQKIPLYKHILYANVMKVAIAIFEF